MRIFFLLMVLLLPLLAGIVPVKPREIGQDPGWSGALSASLQTNRGNVEKDNYTAAIDMTYDNNTSYLVWGMIRSEYGEASGVKNADNAFAHLRYIRRIVGNTLVGELYVQADDNEFKSIRDRMLGGGGLRWKFSSDKDVFGGLFLGVGAFYEYVGYTTDTDPAEHNARLNTYLSYTVYFLKNSLFGVIGYYQPKADDFDDYAVNLSAKLEIPIYQQLFFSLVTVYTHDSAPAVGRKKDDFMQLTQFTWKF